MEWGLRTLNVLCVECGEHKLNFVCVECGARNCTYVTSSRCINQKVAAGGNKLCIHSGILLHPLWHSFASTLAFQLISDRDTDALVFVLVCVRKSGVLLVAMCVSK